MSKKEDTGSPGWSTSYFMQTTEDVARAVAAAAATVRSPRPSVVFSSKADTSGSQLQKLQRQVTRVLKGFADPPPGFKSVTYNPEVLTSQKRQWASFQLQYLDHRTLIEPSRLFESMVVVGLPPNCDIQALQRQYSTRKPEGPGKLRSALNYQNCARVEPDVEPEVLFVYPRDKQLPLKYKDLLSFCFPGGVEVHAVEKTPSMSELNEILLGQEHLKQSDLSFVFRLQVADDSTLYGCCMLVEEIVQKPSALLSTVFDEPYDAPTLSRHLLTTRRCYCILSRLPFFELHFGVLNSIFAEERLERLTKGILDLEFEFSGGDGKEEIVDSISSNRRAAEDTVKGTAEISQSSLGDSTQPVMVTVGGSQVEHHTLDGDVHLLKKVVDDNVISPLSNHRAAEDTVNGMTEIPHLSLGDSTPGMNTVSGSQVEHRALEGDVNLLKKCVNDNVVSPSSNHIAVEDTVGVTAEIPHLSLGDSTPGMDTVGGSQMEHQMLEGDVHMSEEAVNDNPVSSSLNHRALEGTVNETAEISRLSVVNSTPAMVTDGGGHMEHQTLDGDVHLLEEEFNEAFVSPSDHGATEDTVNGTADISRLSLGDSTPGMATGGSSQLEHQMLEGDVHMSKKVVNDNAVRSSLNHRELGDTVIGTAEFSQLCVADSTAVKVTDGDSHLPEKGVNDNVVGSVDLEAEIVTQNGESGSANLKGCDDAGDSSTNKLEVEGHLPNDLPRLNCYHKCESSESSPSFQDSPGEDTNLRSGVDGSETGEASFSGQEESDDILEWAKVNNHGSLQILCEYYRLRCPERGATLYFHPLEHLHSLEYRRPDGTVLRSAGSTIDLRSCTSSLEFVEAYTALLAEEEASALSAWSVACLCGSLRLENVLTMFAAALLEKQLVVVCSNLGVLSASILAFIPLIRPYQWQSLLMPILPNDMLDFLDAPVPYIVGVKNKTSEVQSKLSNVVMVDANRNQLKASSIPQLPQQKELFARLSPFHAKLVGESYLAKRRPVYECTDVQIEAAKGFLGVLRKYLDTLCCNLRSHTITNVQSNNDKVSLLLKESFIDSFPYRDRPFMKFFVDTQLFSVHTDLVLSFFQKE